MNPLRHLLLVAVLIFAQLAAGAHAIGHAADDAGAVPTHACELCLAADDLASALPAAVARPPVVISPLLPEGFDSSARHAFPVPYARQGAPPDA